MFDSKINGLSPVHGVFPYSISKNITPKDHTSHLAENGYPLNIYGAIYIGDPFLENLPGSKILFY